MAISKSTSNVGKADFLTWYLFCYGQERFCNNFENAFVSAMCLVTKEIVMSARPRAILAVVHNSISNVVKTYILNIE